MTNKYKYKDELMTINELMEFSVVCKSALSSRLRGGWMVDEAVETKKGEKRKLNLSKSAIDKDEDNFNKEHQPKPYHGPTIKVVGEFSAENTKIAEKQTRQWGVLTHKKETPCACIGCGHIGWRSSAEIKKYDKNGYKCYECHMKEKKEFDEAMIAYAKRKGLMK